MNKSRIVDRLAMQYTLYTCARNFINTTNSFDVHNHLTSLMFAAMYFFMIFLTLWSSCVPVVTFDGELFYF